MSSRRVLVTGGAGFIGSHVAEGFLARGDRVWIVDDLSTGRRENVPAGAEFLEADIGSPETAALFRDVGGFDIVDHHAAQIDVRKSVEDPRHDARINLDGFLNVVEAGRRYGVGRVIFISSGGVVYGEPDLRPTPETSPKVPRSPYGVTKLAAEQYLYYYANVHGLEYVALRYSNVYGPRQDPHGEAGVVAIFSSRLHEDRNLTVFGDGKQTRDYVFVGDVVAANMLASDVATSPAGTLDDRAFNVGTGRETSVNDLAGSLMRGTGREVAIEYAAARPGELEHSCLDNRKLSAAGWQARTPLEDGLRQTYEHIAKERDGR
jgi:UDP-glucose 4-epimerase